MRFSECYHKCKAKHYRPSDLFNVIFKSKVDQYYSEKVTKCSRYCVYYVLFLAVGRELFGPHWERTIRRRVNMNNRVMTYCSHCNRVFDELSSIDHVFKIMKERRVDINEYEKSVEGVEA